MLSHVRLEAARGPDFPEGSAAHGYELWLPLTADGRPAGGEYADEHGRCRFVRFRAGEPIRQGAILRHAAGWVLSLEPGEDDDTVLVGADHHRFRPGEYVSLKEPDGRLATFKVVAVTAA
jgi:hypothetical protein